VSLDRAGPASNKWTGRGHDGNVRPHGTWYGHRLTVNVDHLPGHLTVPSFGPRMVYTKCGTIGADVRPMERVE
jgi:hypothetical protein